MSARIWRLLLVVGMGFFAAVLGLVLGSYLVAPLRALLSQSGSLLLGVAAHTLVSRLWILALLPLCCLAAARVLQLRPWRTAVGAALTGELVVAGVTGGIGPGGWELLLRGLTLAGGVGLSVIAIRAVSR